MYQGLRLDLVKGGQDGFDVRTVKLVNNELTGLMEIYIWL